MPQGIIRHPSDRDIKALIEIYTTCFPDRVLEIFGGVDQRVFIGDYLRFYLTWDPANTWVYASEDEVVAVAIAPRQYAPLRAALVRGQVFFWLWHMLTGRYGVPLHILKLFLSSGFAFNTDSVIRELWGRPYIHLFAVAPRHQEQNIGSTLLNWTLDQYRRQGVECCWLVVRERNQRGIAFYQRFEFRIHKRLGSGDIVMIWGDLGAARARVKGNDCGLSSGVNPGILDVSCQNSGPRLKRPWIMGRD
jgi:ribosomal protein S18 acetylase RimI-like enzyme